MVRADATRAPLAAVLREAVRADVDAGRRVRVVLFHDAVARAAWLHALPGVESVHRRDADRTARGLVAAATDLDDAAIVALLAAAGRSASW